MSNPETSTLQSVSQSQDNERIQPIFNPTNIPEDQLYARGIRVDASRDLGLRPHSDFEPDLESIEIWRLERRERVESGLGLIASRAAISGTLGDIKSFNLFKHLSSSFESRADAQTATPFVSFSADPEHLAKSLILRRGFGVSGGLDSVVVRAKVHPSRVLSGADSKEEMLLVGGLSPDEYLGVQEVNEFVDAHVNPDEEVKVHTSGTMQPRDALKYWENSQDKKAA